MRILLLLSVVFSLTLSAQHQAYLDIGNVRALVNSNGLLFHDTVTNRAGFEAPKGDSTYSVFVSAIWMSSTDSLSDSTSKYSIGHELNGRQGDIAVGPVDILNQKRDTSSKFQRLWKIDKNTINNHIANWNQPNYQTPNSILDWPGNGNSNTAKILAPFKDVDGDSLYEPNNGEYPLILGDQAIFLMANDFSRNQFDSVFLPVRDPNNPFVIIDSVFRGIYSPTQIEIHIMVYAYLNTPAEISNTVFVKTTLFHRSNLSILDHNNFKFSTFNDFDIGRATDDYMGTDTNRNLVYVYNSNDFDPGNSIQKGYGNNIGSQGIKYLNHNLTSSIELVDNSAIGRVHEKRHVPLYQSSRWTNGRPLNYGGNGFNYCIDSNRLSKFYFPGNPTLINDNSQWTELNYCPRDSVKRNNPNDKRVIATIGILPPFNHSTSVEINYAYIFAQDSGGVVASVAALQVAADSVQAFYDRNRFVGINENTKSSSLEFNIYPNPAKDKVFIETDQKSFYIELFNVEGRMMNPFTNTKHLDISYFPNGIYFIRMSSKNKIGIQKLVISR